MACKVLSLTGSRTRSGAYGVVRAVRQNLRPCAVLSIMRRRNSIDSSSELRGEVQGNVHARRVYCGGEIHLTLLQNYVARFRETFTPDGLYASSVDSVTSVPAGGEFTPDGLYYACGDSMTPETRNNHGQLLHLLHASSGLQSRRP